jgi:hypothetical protein
MTSVSQEAFVSAAGLRRGMRVLRVLLLVSSSCLSGAQFLYPQFRRAKFFGYLLLDFNFQSLQKEISNEDRVRNVSTSRR